MDHSFPCQTSMWTLNSNSSIIHDNDAANEQVVVFGHGSSLSGWYLCIGFLLVAIYMTLANTGLNFLEAFTTGTTYNLMLQRMYREMMMMGLSSFVWTIVSASGTPLPVNLLMGFQYADVNAFTMSLYFCFQGVFIMASSVGQARAWDRASKISSEELQIDVVYAENTYRWRWNYLPLCRTRDLVEFRILQSIFSSAYSISTRHSELDFGLFLKITHETNLLGIIDFSTEKWVLVLVLTCLASIKIGLYESACTTPACEAREEIYIFTICGSLNLFISFLLFIWGRQSELRLLSTSGIEGVDDFGVFMMVESKMNRLLERNVAKHEFVKTAIVELVTEAETSKLEKSDKLRSERKQTLSKIAQFVPRKPARVWFERGRNSKGVQDIQSTGSSGGNSCSPPMEHLRGGAGGYSEVFHGLTELSGIAEMSEAADIESGPPMGREGAEQGPESAATPYVPSPHNTRSSLCANGDAAQKTDKPSAAIAAATMAAKRALSSCRSNQYLRSATLGEGFQVYQEEDVSDGEGENGGDGGRIWSVSTGGDATATTLPPLDRKSSLKGSVHSVFKDLTMKLGTGRALPKMGETGASASRHNFKSKMKKHYQRQNFKEVFVFGRPDVFYMLIDFVIACNSLYLAWWSTNFVMVAFRGDVIHYSVLLAILSLLPAVFTFPLVSQAIKSSSILKAISKLNLDVLAAVVDKTEHKTKILADFREKLLSQMSDPSRTPKQQLLDIFAQYDVDNSRQLTREEFRSMLSSFRIHYPPQKWKFVFNALDLDQDSLLSLEVSSSMCVRQCLAQYCDLHAFHSGIRKVPVSRYCAGQRQEAAANV